MPGLSVSDVVRVDVNMSPIAVPLRNFGSLCIAGPSNVIDTSERLREYSDIDGVIEDFPTTSPEYLAASLFFAQAPQPSLLYIGRFAQTPTSAVLHGGIFTPSQQATLLGQLTLVTNGSMAITIDGTVRTVGATYATLHGGSTASAQTAALLTTLQLITNGGFAMTIDGTLRQIAAINFSAATSLTDCAAAITSKMSTWAQCSWDILTNAFVVRSMTSGVASSLTYASAPAAGTDVSATLLLTAATNALPPVAGTAGMDFHAITNLNGAASIVTAALTGANCLWDGQRFTITNQSSGVTSTLSYAGPAGSGTDVSTAMRLTAAAGALAPVNGIAAETPLQCVTALRTHPEWYGFQFATTAPLPISDHSAVASFIEACRPRAIYGYTSQATAALDASVTTDIFSAMKALNLQRTFGQFSSTSPYASASMFGRAFTVDFEANNSVLTLKFKQEPAVQAEVLTQNQAAALKAKNANVFVFYANGAPIIQEGVMSNGFFFDEVHNLDWQANRVETDLFNVLYQSPTKIPQTNQGIHVLVATVTNSLAQGVTNGMIAPGQWNAPGFGQIKTGQYLPQGYYVYAPLLETQPQSIREQRIAPTIQCAIKLAGAIHFASVQLNVNR